MIKSFRRRCAQLKSLYQSHFVAFTDDDVVDSPVMSLTKEEIKALRLLISKELRVQLEPFRDDVNRRFDDVDRRFNDVNQRFEQVDRRFEEVNQRFVEVALQMVTREEFNSFRDEVSRRFDNVATQIDGLYLRDEKREQEYLIIREQIQRLEAKIA